jgi:hypothetical protein
MITKRKAADRRDVCAGTANLAVLLLAVIVSLQPAAGKFHEGHIPRCARPFRATTRCHARDARSLVKPQDLRRDSALLTYSGFDSSPVASPQRGFTLTSFLY